MFKLVVNGIEMPEIFFNYDDAKRALNNIIDNNCATGGYVKLV